MVARKQKYVSGIFLEEYSSLLKEICWILAFLLFNKLTYIEAYKFDLTQSVFLRGNEPVNRYLFAFVIPNWLYLFYMFWF